MKKNFLDRMSSEQIKVSIREKKKFMREALTGSKVSNTIVLQVYYMREEMKKVLFCRIWGKSPLIKE